MLVLACVPKLEVDAPLRVGLESGSVGLTETMEEDRKKHKKTFSYFKKQ
jgi:hypothetical protein